MISQFVEISNQFRELQEKYNLYLPKVDPALINDLLLRQMENPSVNPLFMVEVFIKSGARIEDVRAAIKVKTGMNPRMYDNNTHCVITQKLTMDILQELSDLNEVVEITGKYIGSLEGYETFPEQRHQNESEEKHHGSLQTSSSFSSSSTPTIRKDEDRNGETKQSFASLEKETKRGNKYRIAALTAVGIVAIAAVGGFIVSGGMLPNVNQDGIPPETQTTPSTSGTLAPGAIHGYVEGPTGLPAIGASVVAANQETGYTANALISINGQYILNNLPAGEYIVMVAYPDGTNDVANAFQVNSGSDHELDFSY